ncbi:Cas9 inhibitor AcrIIA9 family protein [Bacteroides acidifaciens]|uniref:Cas9 inhibitor AcrIIA9 family protein n=1 Tax=Bacteroides acidifaciens TaxID=85831 RepID=UPI003F68F592
MSWSSGSRRDALLRRTTANPAKNIDDCVDYILNYVAEKRSATASRTRVYGKPSNYYD